VDTVRHYSVLTEIRAVILIGWIGIRKSKFYEWRKRYGKVNEHNALVPRDFWIEEWERQEIIAFYLKHRDDGYRRVTFMMLDLNIVAVSPATTYRVLSKAGLLGKWNNRPSKKGTGFVQPEAVHMHWHIDISHINIRGTYFFVCAIIDGYSRYIIHWDIRPSMKKEDIQLIILKAHEKFPEAKPNVISDNGSQFISRDFKELVRILDMRPVNTSPYYPQSNGKIERFFSTLKKEAVRPRTPLSLEDARRVMEEYIEIYNNIRPNSAIGYIAPKEKLDGKEKIIFDERDRRLEQRREERRQLWISKRKNNEKIPLTKAASYENIQYAGQTETGSAGEQPVRAVRASCFTEYGNPGVNIAPGNPTKKDICCKIAENSKKTQTLQEISN
jgi:putative transposase